MSVHEFSPLSSGESLELKRTSDARLRRSLDISCAVMAGALLAPVAMIVALAIWIEDGRPILFSQHRLGQHGRPFRMYKFRKFRRDCDCRGSPLTLEHDDRLTGLGRFLALSKLDELPQLWNLACGDMSLVGPRPESLAFKDCFCNGFEKILAYKPGLFGPCQALFRHESRHYPAELDPAEFYRRVLFPAKAAIDLAYFSRRTVVSDLGWVARTAWAVVAATKKEATLVDRPDGS